MMALRFCAALALSLLALSTPAQAQDYPSRPVTIVVPFAAGGGTDLLARMVAQKLEQRLGKPFLIENKPGAGSTIGANHVAKATADGYTLLMAPSPTMAVAVSIYRSLPYDPATDFVPLALVAQTPFCLVVNPALPIRSVADLIKAAKDKPGELAFGSAGPGTPHHLFAELFMSMTGVKMNHVPYRGSNLIINDVTAGHLPLTFVDFGPAVGTLKGGQIRPIGISTRTRLASFPDIPPIADTVPGFDAASWQMLVAPAGTPKPILDRLHAEAKAIAAAPDITARVLEGGMLPMDNPSIEGLQAFVKAEIARWAKVVAQAGLTGTQ